MMPVYIQIRRWLMQPVVWRFVGFVSSIVGLLCYALSSSFHHLFGHWNFFKIFLYFIFSFIIIFISLFAKVWQHSTSTLFRTHLAVLVLIATTVYSFFYDIAVNQKPDAYIVISCVAFAFMSLSLSKQSQCGCEVDFLNFFLGCLIILLMKINLWLCFVGVGFSYCLIVIRSCSDITPQSEYFELQDHIAIQVDSQQDNSVVQVHSQQDSPPVMTLDVSTVEDQVATQVDSELMPQLMACINSLKEKDLIFIKAHPVFVLPEIIPNIKELSPVTQLLTRYNIDSVQIINNLLTRNAGFEKECCHVYNSCRREFLGKCLDMPSLDFNKEEDSIEIRTKRWTKASYIALRILFPSERRLCDRIFFGFSSAADHSFMDICREFTSVLLSFPCNFVTPNLPVTRLGSSLKVFQALSDLIPDFESLFSDASTSLMNEAITTCKRLGEGIKVNFIELLSSICSDITDMAQKAAPNGGIDPITHHVKSCLNVISEGWDTLDQVLKEYPIVSDRDEMSSSLSIQMDRIMELLECNLEARSNDYTDPALGYVFMMNNCSYILQWVKNNELATILGDVGIGKHTAKVKQNFEHYQRTWDKVMDILKLDSNESEESMKMKLELFNKQFKDMCIIQSTWFVLDEQLRKQLRISIQENLLPSYGNFVARFQNLLGKHAYEYIEYGIYDIDALLNDLFRGSEIRSLEIENSHASKVLREKSD